MKKNLTFIILSIILTMATAFANAVEAKLNDKNTIFFEGFNQFWEPSGWTFTQMGNSLQQWEQALPGYLGPGAKHTYTSDAGQFSNAWMISPPITLNADGSFFLSFWEKNEHLPYLPGSFSGVYISSGSGVAGHEDFQVAYTSNQPISNYTLKEIDVSSYAGQTIYIAFVYKGAYSHDWYVDEVSITEVTILQTTLLMESPIGQGTVTPAPGSYDYSFLEGNEPIVDLSALPGLGYTFDGWNQGNVANPAHPRTTITMDQDHTVQATFQAYPEDMTLFWHKHGFQNMGGNSTVDAETNLETLDNFSNNNIDEITKVVVYGYASKWDGGEVPWIPQNTEPFIVRFYDAPQNALPTAFGDPVSEQNISAKVFKHGVEQFGTIQRTIYKFELDLLDPVDLQSGWVSVQINGNQGAEGWFIWIAGQTGQGNGNNSSFRRNRNNNTFLVLPHDVHLEIWGTQVQIPVPPSCVIPLFPADQAENAGYPIGTNPVITLSWSAAPDADGYMLYFGETLPDEGINLGMVTQFSPENLSYNTTYQWKVVPYNQDGPAEGCDTWTFTTIEDPTITPPFVVFFDPSTPNTVPPAGWDDRKQGMLTDNTQLEPSTTQWLYRPFANVPANDRAARTYLAAGGKYTWFISPPVALPEQTHSNVLYFDVAITNEGSPVGTQLTQHDKIRVVISDDGGATWSESNAIFTLSGANGDDVEQGGETFAVSLADYQGIIKIGFYVERTQPAAAMHAFIGNITAYEAFTLSLEANPAEGGSTSGTGIYAEGEEVELSASANAGYIFTQWTNSDGEVVSSEATFIYTMPASDQVLTAHFELVNYTFTVIISPDDAGTVAISPEQDFYNIGNEISLVATPMPDFAFAEWRKNGAVLGTEPTLLFTMPAEDVSITAHFVSTLPQVYTLTLVANPENAGMVTGEGNYEEGTQVNVSAIANDGFDFANWTDLNGAVISTQASFHVMMPSMDFTLVAVFQLQNSVPEIAAEIVELFPNPVSTHINIKAQQTISLIEIIDLSGKVLLSEQPNLSALTIYNLDLPSGIYLIKIQTANKTITRKLIIQK